MPERLSAQLSGEDPDAGASASVRWWRSLRSKLTGVTQPTYEPPSKAPKPPRVWVTIQAQGVETHWQIWSERVDLDGLSLRDIKLERVVDHFKRVQNLPTFPSEAERLLWFVGRIESAHSRMRARLGDRGFVKKVKASRNTRSSSP